MTKTTEQIIIHNTTKQELLNDLAKIVINSKSKKELLKEVFYIPDVAKRIKKSEHTVRKLVREGKIKYLQEKKGSHIMFNEEHIKEYLDSCKTVSRAEEISELRQFTNNPFGHDTSKY